MISTPTLRMLSLWGTLAVTSPVARPEDPSPPAWVGAMMTWEDYAAGQFARPYVVRIRSGPGELVYFGAEHSSDPDHAQFAELQTLWRNFEPQAALHEGQARQAGATLADSIRTSGEPGLVRFLAAEDGIPCASMDPDVANQAAFLRTRYPDDLTRTYFALRYIVRLNRFGETRPVEPLVAEYLAGLDELAKVPGAPRTLEELNECFARHLPGQGTPLDAVQPWFDPLGKVNRINTMSRELADHRNRHMVAALLEQVGQGRRVIAVVGRTHAIMQEPALRQALAP